MMSSHAHMIIARHGPQQLEHVIRDIKKFTAVKIIEAIQNNVQEIPGSRNGNARTLKLESHQVLEMYEYILQTRKEILEKSGEKTDKLFISIEGGSDLANYMTRLMVRLRKQNKLVVNAKQIRASVIVKWLKQYNLRQVQYLAGHRYISSTEAYRINEMEGLTEEVNKFHPLG